MDLIWIDPVAGIRHFIDPHSPCSIKFSNDNITVYADVSGGVDEIICKDRVFADRFVTNYVKPRLLSLQNDLVLHASSVKISGKAIAFLGQTGAGKSTLVAGLWTLGWDLLGDDSLIARTNGEGYSVEPVHTELALLPDSAQSLGFANAKTSLGKSNGKCQIQGTPNVSPNFPIPLGAFFVLNRSANDQIETRKLTASQLCMSLVENSFSFNPTDTNRACARLKMASGIAQNLSAWEISYPRQYDRISDVRTVIEQLIKVETSK